MPDLGEYAGPVLAAYGVSLALLAVLVLGSFWQWRRTKRTLDEVERDG